MNFQWVIKQLRSGHKVKRDRYLEGDYFYLDNDTIMFDGPGWDGPSEACFNQMEDFESNDWGLYVDDYTKLIEIITSGRNKYLFDNCINPNTIRVNENTKDILNKLTLSTFQRNYKDYSLKIGSLESYEIYSILGMTVEIDNSLEDNECVIYNNKYLLKIK